MAILCCLPHFPDEGRSAAGRRPQFPQMCCQKREISCTSAAGVIALISGQGGMALMDLSVHWHSYNNLHISAVVVVGVTLGCLLAIAPTAAVAVM